MRKIKQNNPNLKISKPNQDQAIKEPDKPVLSFVYLTSNSRYNFDIFGKDKHNRLTAKEALVDRLIQLTQQPWIYWQSLGKKQGGLETLKASNINFLPQDYTFSEDEKVIVFRFCSDAYRIIGFQDSSSPTYHIIGFDFDHSAYDHG